MGTVNRPRVSRLFIQDLELYLEDDGDTEAGKEEVREHLRAMLCDDRRQEALDWVKMKADIIRSRNSKAIGITARIKSTIPRKAPCASDETTAQGD